MQRSSATCSVTNRDWQSARKLGFDCLFYAHTRARARAQGARQLADAFLQQPDEHSAGRVRAIDGRTVTAAASAPST